MLHHTDTGTGHPVIFIHGFCETLAIWNAIIPAIANDYRCIAVDLPGFGGTPISDSPISMEKTASILKAFLEEKNIARCTIIGHSLGGYIGLAFAEAFPQQLVGLGLVHSTAFADTAEKKSNRNKTIAFIEKRGVKLFFSTFVASLFADNNHHSIPEIKQIATQTPLDTVLRYTTAMRDRNDRAEVLSNLKFEVLIIAGEKDSIVSQEVSEANAKLPKKCAFELMQNTGHMGMYEQPDLCAETLQKYLANTGERTV